MAGINDLVVDANSSEEFCEKLAMAMGAGVSVIHVRTTEVLRAVDCVARQTFASEGGRLFLWSASRAMREYTAANLYNEGVAPVEGTEPIAAALDYVWRQYRQFIESNQEAQAGHSVYAFLHPQLLAKNPTLLSQVMDLYQELPATNIRIVFIGTDEVFPMQEYHPYLHSIYLARPGFSELKEAFVRCIDDLSVSIEQSTQLEDREIAAIVAAGKGMTLQEFSAAVALGLLASISENDDATYHIDPEEVVRWVRESKTEVIKGSDLLTLMEPGDIEQVGGMENLKDWIRLRVACYSEEAVKFGIEPPKGLVLVGVPGTGKSLVAKAVAGILDIPLVRLDFGRMFNSLIGSSESRMRQALSMIESMAPCVCFADEIDKGLGGIGGGGDSGVSMRVLGQYLTWLQECRLPVFNVVTANNVTGLPPELLRRGRFDGIFSTTLPNSQEREAVLAIHCKQRKHDLYEEFSTSDIARLVKATDGYVPAEIESAVKDGLILAFAEDKAKLTVEHILSALGSMVPLSRSHKEAMDAMMTWARDNATPASYSEAQVAQKNPPNHVRRPGPRITRVVGKKPVGSGNITSLAARRERKPEEGQGKD